MLRWTAACAILLVGSVALADDLPANVKKLIEDGEIQRNKRLAELQGGVNILKARLHEQMLGEGGLGTGVQINAIGRQHAIDAIQAKIDAVLQDMDAIKAQKVFYPNITMKTMQVGDIGILADSFGVGTTAKIAKIVDDENMIVTIDSQPLLLHASTKGQKVGKQLALTMPLEVTGTKAYRSTTGTSKKMFTLAPFHLPDIPLPPQQATKSLPGRFR